MNRRFRFNRYSRSSIPVRRLSLVCRYSRIAAAIAHRGAQIMHTIRPSDYEYSYKYQMDTPGMFGLVFFI
jgi:hypothetical protein